MVLAIELPVAAFSTSIWAASPLQVLKDIGLPTVVHETHSAAAAALFVLAYVAVTGLSLPGAVILTLAGGFSSGCIGHALSKSGGDDGRDARVSGIPLSAARLGGTKVWKVAGSGSAGLLAERVRYLMTLRLIPLFPFFVVNLVSGLTRMNVGTTSWRRPLGLSGSFVYAYAGRQLGTINSLKDIASPE